jgi:hypothetical protein
MRVDETVPLGFHPVPIKPADPMVTPVTANLELGYISSVPFALVLVLVGEISSKISTNKSTATTQPL